jgi:hypothetical protein
MFYLQLNQAQKISDHRLMEELGEDFDLESERMREEIKKQLQSNRRMQVASADIQGEAQLRTSRYQAKAQALTMRAQGQVQMEMQQAAQQAAAQQQAQGAMPQDPAAQQGPAGDQAQQTPGLPEGATAYDENAATPNQDGMPAAMASAQSPIQPGSGGVDLRYIAQRAASFLRMLKKEQGEEAMYQALQQMQMENPPLYQLVIQLMNDRGSQIDPLNAQQNPAPNGTPQADPGRAIG